jgi:hypothetical protein
MKSTGPIKILFLTFGLLLPMANIASAHRLGVPNLSSPYITPPVVRLTGTLVPLQKPEYGGLDTLKVWVNNQEWIFELSDVETLSGTNYGPMILSQLFPREMRFEGPDTLMQPIRNAAVTGKPLTVEGRLYMSDRVLMVTDEGASATNPH